MGKYMNQNEVTEIKDKVELYNLFPKNAVGAELGVCQGDNAVMLWNITKPSTLYLVDTWVKVESSYQNCPPHLYYDDWREMVRNKLPNPNVHLIRSDTIEWLKSIPDNSLDWVYIDSLHQYFHVNIEYELAVQKVKKGGVIAGHDFYCHPIAWKTGIIRAVLNQVQKRNLLITHITCESELPSTMGINIKEL